MNNEFDRFVTGGQMLLYRGNAKYDIVTMFSFRPVELLELCPNIRNYFRWFTIDNKAQSVQKIESELKNDVIHCPWFDVLGRRVHLRKHALEEFKLIECVK